MSDFNWEQVWVDPEGGDYIVVACGNFAWMVPVKPRDDGKEPTPVPKRPVEAQ